MKKLCLDWFDAHGRAIDQITANIPEMERPMEQEEATRCFARLTRIMAIFVPSEDRQKVADEYNLGMRKPAG